jgi:hypothetical protein
MQYRANASDLPALRGPNGAGSMPRVSESTRSEWTASGLEPLPFIDEHRIGVSATPERVWAALQRLARGRLSRPAPAAFKALWGLEPASGFAVAEEAEPRHLALRGRHRFSRYELSFEVGPGPDTVTLSARTSAIFPGIAGTLYRSVVIGSGGHGVIVRRLLAAVAQAAEREPN